MYYPGSKERIARDVLFYVLRGRNGRPYVEPFMGGANIMSNVAQAPRYGNDVNPYLISMWQALQRGWIPPDHVTEQEYTDIKNDKEHHDPALVGYAGFVCSFNACWFAGYRGVVTRVRTNRSGERVQENQQQYARNHLMRQVPAMAGVVLSSGSYSSMVIPHGSIVMCDPPYRDVAMPYLEKTFDSDAFWQWARHIAHTDAIIFTTEYTAPDDFISIWEESASPIGGTRYGNIHANKLFVHESQYATLDTSPPTPTPLPRMRIP